jgi:uncharacterized protein (DUF1778 family)
MPTKIKEVTIYLRVKPRKRELIDRTAALTFKSRTDFMLEASCQKAEEVLLNQRLIIVTDEQFEAFERAFDMPLSENKGLRDLMSDKYSW